METEVLTATAQLDPGAVIALLQSMSPEQQAAMMAGMKTPEAMGAGTVLANLGWALFDMGIAMVVFAVVCSWKPLSRLLFEYDQHLDDRAQALAEGRLKDPGERGQVAIALARVKSAKIYGFLILMGLALVQ